ncbi:MAG: hypothetical protein ABEJ36_05065 [Candidatus Nanosalina sp.]
MEDERKLMRDLEYFDDMEDTFGERYQEDLDEVTFEELKIRDQDQEFTVLRVYDDSSLVAADIYERDGKSRKTTELEMMESESPDWLENDQSALSILNRYSRPELDDDVEEKNEVEDAYRKIVGDDAPEL